MKIVAIQRATRFSPNSVDKDEAILQGVFSTLEGEKTWLKEEELKDNSLPEADLYLSMARDAHTLQLLNDAEQQGRLVINSARGVLRCERIALFRQLRSNGIPIPSTEGNNGYWLKSGGSGAESKDDVVYCATKQDLEHYQQLFAQRGIIDTLVQAHIPGDLIKFYGVRGLFFTYYYPSDDGISKFGDEAHNGQAQHYSFDNEKLGEVVNVISSLTGVEVYGGDAIITESGQFYMIDFNDWPSFSRCKDQAIQAIGNLITDKIKHINNEHI